jgi:predicted enzyme related to lactoylglutathione lyase
MVRIKCEYRFKRNVATCQRRIIAGIQLRSGALLRLSEWHPFHASAAEAGKLGGKVVAPPFDVPEVGRIAVVLDPQGAAIGLFKPAA